MESICFPPTADCRLPTAYCLLPTAYCPLPTAHCLLPTAYCLLPTAFEGGGMERVFARMTTLDKMSPPTGEEETSNFKK
jgi:hypothetical protein